MNLKIHPALTINDQVYMGKFVPEDLAHAICAGFRERPAHCTRYYIKDFLTKREKWHIPDYGNPIAYDIIALGGLLCIVNCVVLYYCKNKTSNISV